MIQMIECHARRNSNLGCIIFLGNSNKNSFPTLGESNEDDFLLDFDLLLASDGSSLSADDDKILEFFNDSTLECLVLGFGFELEWCEEEEEGLGLGFFCWVVEEDDFLITGFADDEEEVF